MQISKILNIATSVWEDQVISAMFLKRSSVPEGVFPTEVQSRLREGLIKLSSLPCQWADELCVQVMLNAVHNCQ